MNLALFDFDGTITNKEAFGPFLHRVVPLQRKLLLIVLVYPLLWAYRMKLIHGSFVRSQAIRWGVRGLSMQYLNQAGKEFAQQVIPQWVRPEVMHQIQWHLQQGDEVVVVSASLSVYLKYWCQTQGLGLICSELEQQQGKASGQYLNGDCSRDEKAKRILAQYRLEQFDRIYAYGDTTEDYAMLHLADEKFFRGKKWVA